MTTKPNWSGRGQAKRIIYADNPVTVRGDALGEIFWQGREWAVTAYGIERRDGCYFIAASRLCEDHSGSVVHDENGKPVP